MATRDRLLLDDFSPKKGQFKKVVSRILTVNRSLKVGIKRSNLREWHELNKFRTATEQDHKQFVASVLTNFQLMGRFSRFMRQSEEFFCKAEEVGSRVSRGTWKPFGRSPGPAEAS